VVKSENECCNVDKFWKNGGKGNELEVLLKQLYSRFVAHTGVKRQLQLAARHISAKCKEDTTPLNTLSGYAERMLKSPSVQYRILDAEIVGFDGVPFVGVLPFLSLLGFELDAKATTVKCRYDPPAHVLQSAIYAIDAELYRLVRPKVLDDECW